MNPGHKDFGRNGTYLVFRQIQQHVDEFWKFMADKSRRPNGEVDHHSKVKLASKMIGRWPEGAPLVKHPENNPKINSKDNDFLYAKEDPHGFKCPLGSHLRRNNPRDNFRDQDAKQSLKVTKRHRILRRGRLYDIPKEQTPEGKREKGLLFIGVNSDIQKQFEFIQHVWANNLQPNKKTLFNDPDPIIGTPDPEDPRFAFTNRFSKAIDESTFFEMMVEGAVERVMLRPAAKQVLVYLQESSQKDWGVFETMQNFPDCAFLVDNSRHFIERFQSACENLGKKIEFEKDETNYRFTIQQKPVAQYVSGLERFVTIRGGDYFFMPGISALRYLTTLGINSEEGGG